MKDAVDKLKSMSSDPLIISEIEKKQIEEYCRKISLEDAEEKGKNEGKQNEKIEIAKNLLAKNIDVNIISECTGLSIEEVNNLKE